MHGDLDRVRAIFRGAPFVHHLGIEPISVSQGECETVLELKPHHLQHTGRVHAGVITTMADHTAGAAAQGMVEGEAVVVTAELKVSLLRAVTGARLVCRARVLKPGRQVTFAESEVFCDGQLVAKLSATMALVPLR